jgi:peptide/nickel transport system permease protein/oligopeptide transport system permease protein
MATFVIRRLLVSVVVLFGVTICVFLMLHLIPGDPAEVMLSEQGGAADVSALRHDLGLDRPLYVQYGLYMKRVLSGDLGESIRLRLPVRELIVQRAPKTLELTIAALALAVVGGVFAGVLSAVYRGRAPDHAAMLGALVGVSLPSFWLGLMLILLFGVKLQWLPIAGADEPLSIVMPAVTLAVIPLAIIARLMRSSLLEVLGEDYIRTAKAKGVPHWKVIGKHGLRNSVIPVITVVGIQFGTLLGGAIIVETVFAWPGIGRLLIDAVTARDFPLVQGIVLFVATGVVVVNLLADILYAYVDPRIEYS